MLMSIYFISQHDGSIDKANRQCVYTVLQCAQHLLNESYVIFNVSIALNINALAERNATHMSMSMYLLYSILIHLAHRSYMVYSHSYVLTI